MGLHFNDNITDDVVRQTPSNEITNKKVEFTDKYTIHNLIKSTVPLEPRFSLINSYDRMNYVGQLQSI